jgi:ADP-ribose pyrophosphatase
VYLRKDKAIPHGGTDEHLLVAEIVAGMLEAEDDGEGGIERRAVAECMEEAGARVERASIAPLGGPMFASPGLSDEMVHYRCVETDLDALGTPTGDGSVMEEAGQVVVLSLDEAIDRCRAGSIPDAKTEIALVRLRDRLADDQNS